MNVRIGFAALGLGLFAATPSAFAQVSPAAPVQPGSAQTIPEKEATTSPQRLKEHQVPSTLQNGRSDSLSTKLNQSGGVIKPRGDMDPGINANAPVAQPNSTPVIPPSATGGENAK